MHKSLACLLYFSSLIFNTTRPTNNRTMLAKYDMSLLRDFVTCFQIFTWYRRSFTGTKQRRSDYFTDIFSLRRLCNQIKHSNDQREQCQSWNARWWSGMALKRTINSPSSLREEPKFSDPEPANKTHEIPDHHYRLTECVISVAHVSGMELKRVSWSYFSISVL